MSTGALPLPKVYTLSRKWSNYLIIYLIISVVSGAAALIQLFGLIFYHSVLITPRTILFALLLYLCALIMATICYICASIYRQGKAVRLELLPEGLTFYYIGFRIYTPWQNLSSIDDIPLGKRMVPGLLLKEPALTNMTLEEGRQEGKAVAKYNWWSRRSQRYLNGFPVIVADTPSLDQGEFGDYLKRYAPQVLKKRAIGSL